jgi:hypothetical protein
MGSNLKNTIQEYYDDLSQNLKLFNTFRKSPIPIIGLDISCLTKDCSNPFFPLSEISGL